MMPERPPLVSQPHGGAIYRGGVRGNAGNRIKKRVQREAMHLVAARMPVLASIADGVVVEFSDGPDGRQQLTLASPSPAERTNAMKLLWDVASSGQKVNMAEVRKRLTAQVAAIREVLPPEQAESLLESLERVWR